MPPENMWFDLLQKASINYSTSFATSDDDLDYYDLLLGDNRDDVNPKSFYRCLLFGRDIDDHVQTFAERDDLLDAICRIWYCVLQDNGVTIDFATAPESLVQEIAHHVGLDSMVEAVLSGVPDEDVLPAED